MIIEIPKLKDLAYAKLRSTVIPHDGIKIYSRWDLEHYRDGKLIHSEYQKPNLYTTEGISYILNTIFKNQTRLDPWYIGLNATNNPAAGWTMANKGTTWNAFTSVDESTWPEAVDGSISNGQIAMTQVTFNVSSSGTVYGAHITSNNSKSGTSGTLLCAVNFSASRSVEDNDQILITYTVGIADDGA